MQDGGVVSTSKTAADFRQRPQRHGLGQIHCDLAGPNHVGGATRRQDIRAADIEMRRDKFFNVLDLDPFRLADADEVADRGLGRFYLTALPRKSLYTEVD